MLPQGRTKSRSSYLIKKGDTTIRKNAPFERYVGIDEDAKQQDISVPSKGQADNSVHPVGYGRGVGDEDVNHGPGVTPNPDKTTGPGVNLKK